jgi:hypothetical protein
METFQIKKEKIEHPQIWKDGLVVKALALI